MHDILKHLFERLNVSFGKRDGPIRTKIPMPRPTDPYLSPNFRRAEFACNHCGKLPYIVPAELLEKLEKLRFDFRNKPVVVTSGYRCPVHNANVGGAPRSLHLVAKAADIWIPGVSPRQIFDYFNPTHQGGLSLYRSFVHIDVRGQRARW